MSTPAGNREPHRLDAIRPVSLLEPGSEIFEWIGLCRVGDGGVSTDQSGDYLHRGRPLHGEVADALARLSQAGCLALGAPDLNGHRTVSLTVAGAIRHAELKGTFHGG